MPNQSEIFNRFLADVSDHATALQKTCEKYSDLWEEQMLYDAKVDVDENLYEITLKDDSTIEFKRKIAYEIVFRIKISLPDYPLYPCAC